METILTSELKLSAIIKSARSILEKKSFEETARVIFDQCIDLTGAISGYVALLSDDGHENEVLFLEAGGLPCSVNPELPMPIRGLRAIAYKTHKPAYDNDFMHSEWAKFLPKGHVGLKNVLFAPLNIGGKTVGIIGLANKPAGFTDDDAEIAALFGELAAVGLLNSRHIQLLNERTVELKTALDEIKALSNIDGLTGIANRRYFDEVLKKEYDRHRRSGKEISLIMFDVDFFKLFNDFYGHIKGDECLQLLSRVISECATRSSDLIARYGGEEFICILPETNSSAAVAIA